MNSNSKKTERVTRFIVLFVIIFMTSIVLFADSGHMAKRINFLDVLLLPRIWVSAIFCLIGFVLLIKSFVTHNLRLISLFVIFFTFAVVSTFPIGNFARGMGMHPSPLCSIVKPFIFIKAGRAVPIVFTAILFSVAVLTIIGNKLFCGWVCPIGALQEIFHRIPLSKKFKIKIPFKIPNTIRISIFILFIILLFTARLNIYEYFNPFEFLHWGFELLAIFMLSIVLIASIFIFRPFCYFICPLGLFTWVLEHISIIRIKVDNKKCTKCNKCVEESPCLAIPAILEEKKTRPDCFACGRCIEICPENALKFRK